MSWTNKYCTRGSWLLLVAILILSVIIVCLLCHSATKSSTGEKVVTKIEENTTTIVTLDTTAPPNVCLTEKCVHSAADISKMIDTTVDPCHDFYKFVCGNFIKNSVIPDHKTTIKTFSIVNDRAKLQLKSLLEKPSHQDDSKPLKLLKTVYQSCMNTTQMETESLIFIRRVFKEMGGWPVIDPNWNERKFDWKQVLFRLRRSGWYLNFFVAMQIDIDAKNSSRRILTITYPHISNYRSLSKGVNHSDTQAYYDHMVRVLSLFGAPKLSASVEMNEVLEFEISLSKIVASDKASASEYNPMTIKELQESVHSIPWLQLINNYLAPEQMLKSKDIVNVTLLKFLKNLEDLLLNTNKRILANYMFWYIVKKCINHLPQKFRERNFDYLRVVKGTARAARWDQCIKEIDKLNVAASYVYVTNFVNTGNKNLVKEMATYIQEAFVEVAQNKSWLDLETKERVILKASKIGQRIGFPDELLNDSVVEEFYKGLELDPFNHFLKINLNVSSFLHKKTVKTFRQRVVKSDWMSQAYCYTANGFFKAKSNSIEIMAALLQYPFFDGDRPYYINFGRIGEVIGHEIIHAFDGEGNQYDEKGNLNSWTPEAVKSFKEKSECFVGQYGNMTIPESGMAVDGVKTLNENIADNGGFKIAYRGYLKWVKQNGEELLLPGLSYSPRQMFWISVATNGCAKYRKEALGKFVSTNVHALEYFRVMVPFMNLEDFSRDFNCSTGSVMNPEDKCEVW